MFIRTPYLPEGKVTLAIAGFDVPGLTIIPPPEIASLPPAVSRHADLGLCPLGGNEVVCPPDTWAYYNRVLSPHGFSVIKGGQAIGVSYPADTAYNVVVAGDFALLNPAVCDKVLLRLLKDRYDILPIKQGYAKCSVAVAGKSSVITGDPGIFRAAEKAGLDALPVKNDGVELPPYKNGFFGGVCGLIAPDALAINGSLRHMPDGEKIKKFLEKQGVRPMELNSGPPFDTGSLIPLMTEG